MVAHHLLLGFFFGLLMMADEISKDSKRARAFIYITRKERWYLDRDVLFKV